MTLVDLTYLILNLSHLVDSDLHKGVSLEEVKEQIERGDVLDWLAKRFEGHIDMSLYRDRPAAGEITSGLQDLLGGYGGSERRKWGIQHNGICLLISWTNELVQQRKWKETAY